MKAANIFYTWRTKKTEKGFKAIVIKIKAFNTIQPETGNYCKNEILKEETFSSRAKAKTFAQKYVRYYKSL